MIDLTKLNAPQREAVLKTEGPLLVLAGAGSGKTRVLTYRIAHLIDRGVAAWRILAITFTNKAAREMRERVLALAGERAGDTWVSTFHACCARILRRDIEKLGYKNAFSIYDDDDQMHVIRAILKEMNLDEKMHPPRAIKSAISDAKNNLYTPAEWFAKAAKDDIRAKATFQVFAAYEKRLRENNALDFDDLLVKTLELFANHPPVLESYQDRFDYVLVDEYQDTNQAQYELVRLLTGQKKNLCVVGDDDQSIYGWRGADVKLILNFQRDFPDASVVKLEQNYRSTGNILNAANQVIAHNRGRMEKALWTQDDDGEKITRYEAMDERDEAAWVVRQMQSLIKRGSQPGDMCVLYRLNAQSRVLEEALVRVGIPYRVYGGQKFYDRKEVKDVIAYLRVMVNPDDSVALRRVINEPRRGIGDTTVDALEAYAQREDVNLFVAVMDAENAGLSGRARAACMAFSELLNTMLMKRFEETPVDFINTVVNLTGIRAQYEKVASDENTARIQNIQELIGAVSQYAAQNPEGGLEGFLENVALVTDVDSLEEKAKALTLMTLHAAKGLEFPNVFMVGLEEGLFPITRAMFEVNQLEEERRLCYVGITRAMKRLFITNARSRMLFGSHQVNIVSRFVEEIPPRLIDDARFRVAAPVRLPSANTRPAQASPRPAPKPYQANPLNIPGVQKGFVASSANPPTDTTLFHAGDRVTHHLFGAGNVLDVRGAGRDARIVIAFDKAGEKTFAAATAPIKLLRE